MRDIARDLGLSQSSVSRNVATYSLATHGRKRLLKTFEDPLERRSKRVTLTTTGARLAEKLLRDL